MLSFHRSVFMPHFGALRQLLIVAIGLGFALAPISVQAAAAEIKFEKHERIAFLGNSLAERMNLFGHFEAMLQLRFADKELVVRNFARPAEEVGIQQRSADYTKIDDPLAVFSPDTFIMFFGFNESFAGPEGLDKYRETYMGYVNQLKANYGKTTSGRELRFILVSPVPVEESGNPLFPDAAAQNKSLALYAQATAEIAKKLNLPYVDVYNAVGKALAAKPGLQYSINGCHLNSEGDQLLAQSLMQAMFGPPPSASIPANFEAVRTAVVDKAWHHLQDYRMLNGWYVYGGRRTWDTETFPQEFQKIRKMVAKRDQEVWALAAGKSVPQVVDDSDTGVLFVPETRFGNPQQRYSEAENPADPKTPIYLTPAELIAKTRVPKGLRMELFADETMFPDLAKPVQLNFDNKGRLWVSCMPSYPQWKPGDPKPNDKLLILEDTDRDGKADKSTVFYDQLACPTGFEFHDGGVVVVDQPRLIFLKDTDGDDKADLVVHLQDGWATDDTHHTCSAFEYNNGGLLHALEGIATSTTLETPWGPHRSYGTGGCYVLDLKTQKVKQFALPGQYNMWCYVFDEWGQGFVGDGTTSTTHWDTPLSGAQFGGRKGLEPVFNNEGMRPALGNEWLVSRQLPPEVQKQFVYACVINMNGLPRFQINDDGAGFKGARLKQDGQPDDLVRSEDKHFRPADPQIGPDGALWFGDWANALIGHMQYSQRDPNRDHTRGRIYRLVGENQPLVEPVTQFGKSIPELLEQLHEYEWRTRYRARRELRDRPATEVLAAVKAWLARLKPTDPDYERLRTEALWAQQAHHAVDLTLVKSLLQSPVYQARAAAVRVVADEREQLPDAFSILATAAIDEHPRVRTEAVRGLSHFGTAQAIDAVLTAATKPMDYWTKYTIEHALAAHEGIWRSGYLSGKLAADNTEAQELMGQIMASSSAGGAAAPYLKTLLSPQGSNEEVRNKAITALVEQRGNPSNGRTVFFRSCVACHRVGSSDGRDFGPNMAGVGTRLTRYKLIESIIDPNAEVNEKYLSTTILTSEGKTHTGLVVSESETEVVIFDGKEQHTVAVGDIEERVRLKQSSMPEGTAGAMAPVEFLDLIDYLVNLK